jgi:Spy/CpxP family protein refolding chaperone
MMTKKLGALIPVMSAQLRAAAVALTVSLATVTCSPALAQKKPIITDDNEAAYAQVLEKRAQGVLEALNLRDSAKAAKVHDAVVAQYRALRTWHGANDATLKALGEELPKAGGEQAKAIEEQVRRLKEPLKALHDRYLVELSAQLTPEQVEKVKDQMTYNKVRVTYDAYCEIVPNLTARDRARILELLKEAREEAMDAGSAAEKAAVFKKYKGRINNYLSAEGHDVGKAYRDWGAKQRAKEGAQQTPPAGGGLTVEQWGMFEIALKGHAAGNPFLEVELSARFTLEDHTVSVAGFYDGDGVYRIRFMPPRQGPWRYETRSNRPELHGKSGSFAVTKPAAGNHGPVRVAHTHHFAYADGTPYFPIGTTCYVWTHQGDQLQEQTLATLKQGPFNKLRMCIFPHRYAHNANEPALYPFAGMPPRTWDFTRFNPAFFRHLEERIDNLRALGIEADLILFHPYDRGHWGFDRMASADDDRYLRYVIARLAAYRNVWWSLANEYDFMKTKKEADWDRFFQIVVRDDPYGHLRSIHNGTRLYNHTHPWVTHASVQNGSAVEDFGRAVLLRDAYRKPIIYDEVKYEGDIEQRWGNLSAEEMVHRFWQGIIAGTYVTHGETYRHPEDILWWTKGGVLHGRSPARLAFLRKILEEGPAEGLELIDKWQDHRTAGKKGEYYLIYFGKEKPREWAFALPRAGLQAPLRLQAEVIDTWAMTVTPLPGVYDATPMGKYLYTCLDHPRIRLPGKPYLALRLRKAL